MTVATEPLLQLQLRRPLARLEPGNVDDDLVLVEVVFAIL